MFSFGRIKKFLRRRNRLKISHEIAPDEILIDATNLPDFDTHQFEGRIERPISSRTLLILAAVFLIIASLYSYKVYALQIKQGDSFAARSENNRLRHTLVFSDRGVIYDRNKE